MRQIRFFTVALMALLAIGAFSEAKAQLYGDPTAVTSYYRYPVKPSTSTYANSQIDTTASIQGVTGSSLLSFTATYADSAADTVYTDYQPYGGSWTCIDSAGYATTSNTGGATEKVLRSSTVNKVTGLAGYLRWRIKFNATGNGVSTNTYGVIVNWKP